MDWNIAEANWKQFKGTVRARWGKLTDEHLEVIGGKRDQLLIKIQELYEVSKPDAQRDLKTFEERNKDYRPKKVS